MKTITDQQLEASVGNMLRIGVTIAAAVVFVGGVLYLVRTPSTLPDYHHFRMETGALRNPVRAFGGLAHGDAESITQVGILLLIATPVVRVLYCLIGFSRQKDKLYIGISATVLLILMYSLFRGAN